MPKEDEHFHQNSASYHFTPTTSLPQSFPAETYRQRQFSQPMSREEEEDNNNQIPAEPTPNTTPGTSYMVRGSDHKAYVAKPVYIVPTPQSERRTTQDEVVNLT
ncbi:MAG: hypothetical protein GY696_09520 [Gammaproteobacteria bacterium]|nr:hypothetical protein [Gammaproteobacteria bacterium]